MPQYQVTLSDEIVDGLFKEDGAMAGLVEQVLNQVLEAEVTEMLQAKPYDFLNYRIDTRIWYAYD